MMSYCWTSKDKVKNHAEVFTPAGTVFDMVTQEGIRDCLKDVDKTIFDPAVGEGQFPCAELVWKMFYNIEKLDENVALRALKSLYGMDIQSVSVDKARAHLLATIFDAYEFFTGKNFDRLYDAVKIISQNIQCGDSLKFMKDLSAPQQSLF